MRMPAPSPASGSAPTAPRCSRFSRMASASSTSWCDLRALQVGDEADAARVVLAAPGRTGRSAAGGLLQLPDAARCSGTSSSNVMASRLSALAFRLGGRSSFCAHRAPSPRTQRAAQKCPLSRGAERPPLHGPLPPQGVLPPLPLSPGSDAGLRCSIGRGGSLRPITPVCECTRNTLTARRFQVSRGHVRSLAGKGQHS